MLAVTIMFFRLWGRGRADGRGVVMLGISRDAVVLERNRCVVPAGGRKAH